MALIFKIKFEDTLRRWVVSELWDQMSLPGGIQELENKIRDLFHIPSAAPIAITYVDNENDVVTLADDQDLLDACLVQRLNPLRVDVKLCESLPEASARPSITPPDAVKDGTAEAVLKACLLRSTSDSIDQSLSKCPPAAELMRNVQFLKYLAGRNLRALLDGSPAIPASSESATQDPFQHPCANELALGSVSKSKGGKVASTRIFHRGVQCDGCGMIPIEGPRFKSMKMYDYDLCSACFEAFGSDTDFQRIDLPVHPVSHGFYHPVCPARWSWQSMGPPAFRPVFTDGPYGRKPECPVRVQQSSFCPRSEAGRKLDARFVKDVNIVDGTEVAPCTKFTKIWLLRNVGTIPWPQKTQLVHIGGDLLMSEERVNLELPEGGLPCGHHIHASVDLVAPEKAGRYVSHWRLMSPARHKFGHRVWVVIQVVPQDEQSEQSHQLQESLRGEETSDGGEEAVILETENREMQNSESEKGNGISISAPSNKPMTSDGDEGKEELVSDTQKFEDNLILENDGVVSDTQKGEDILILENDGVVLDTQRGKDIPILENDGAEEFNGKSDVQDTRENNSSKEPHDLGDTAVLPQVEREQFEHIDSSMMDNEVDGFSVVGKDNEVDGFSVVGKPTENSGWYNIISQGAPESMQTTVLQEQSTENVIVESIKTNQEMQLQLLESMGFMDRDLNADLLKKHHQDLQRTLDDLVAIGRWDNMLKDLQEMGFNDKLTNCRLMLKNQGSMKRVVKDLVEMEKQKVGGLIRI